MGPMMGSKKKMIFKGLNLFRNLLILSKICFLRLVVNYLGINQFDIVMLMKS